MKRHFVFVMHLNIPAGFFPTDPEHGEVQFVLYKRECECEIGRDHSTAIDHDTPKKAK